MPGPRDYSQSTRAALAMLSRGRCYFPDCPAHLVVFLEGEPYIDYQIAHIRDAQPGNRYDPNMSDDERRSFANLVLLCKPHHELVDKRHPERFSVQELTEWKRNREAQVLTQRSGLGSIDEDAIDVAFLEGAKVEITDSIVHLGGTGGSAPGAGGGGGAGIAGGMGGDGGKGGDHVVLDGAPGIAPGAGGGGAGAFGRGAIGGDGGSGGERVTGIFAVSPGDQLEYVAGSKGRLGEDAGPSEVYRVSSDGVRELLMSARGGVAGKSGTSKRDERLGPAVRVTSAFFADAIQLRDGLLFVIGGGWDHYTLASLPGTFAGAFVLIVEPHIAENRETELRFEFRDPEDVVRQTGSQVLDLREGSATAAHPGSFRHPGGGQPTRHLAGRD